MNKIIGVVFLSLLINSSVIYAQDEVKNKTEQAVKLYKFTDKQGRVYYSDQPSKNAVEIRTDLVPTIKMKKSKVSLEDLVEDSQKKVREKKKFVGYSELNFVNLNNNGVIRNNGSTVTLTASVLPALKKGHSINFFLDGQLKKANGKLSVTFDKVNYGPHKASFIIMSSARAKLAQSPVTQFHLMHTVRKKAR